MSSNTVHIAASGVIEGKSPHSAAHYKVKRGLPVAAVAVNGPQIAAYQPDPGEGKRLRNRIRIQRYVRFKAMAQRIDAAAGDLSARAAFDAVAIKESDLCRPQYAVSHGEFNVLFFVVHHRHICYFSGGSRRRRYCKKRHRRYRVFLVSGPIRPLTAVCSEDTGQFADVDNAAAANRDH